MFKKLAEIWKRWSTTGMHVPFVHDPETQKPSVTLMLFYIFSLIAACVAVGSTILMLGKGELLQSNIVPVLLCILGFIFYRLRKLDKVKIDLNDQEIELSSDEEESEEK